ncbi:MAG: DUF3516 domain-containing protein [Acidimicrobiales bacterium]
MMSMPPLVAKLPPAPDPDALLDAFVEYAAEQELTLYPAQEEAILELLSGNNVILNTPTGSGKSLVAVAAHFAALADDRRSFYTAPIKALVSEKFFALLREFGPERVGMITGDAAVNADAPIIACTAEIVANMALRDGAAAAIDMVIMDEFHYYADPQRGWAWQVPLLELANTQFLLMSATLGNTERFETELTQRTGRDTVLVKSTKRPVPLHFEYRDTSLHETLEELIEADRAPVYVVHFTQREATEAAQAFTSIDVLTKDEKQQVNELIGGFRFDSPIGKDLRRFLTHGVGVHHAGLLPKYRLLVEKLAQAGLLKLISGTDTLGVGVNVPIRSVLFTQLCKYDGRRTRVLSVREFQQIAGRAGRKGFDDQGFVHVQPPAHVVDNLRAEKKLSGDSKKKRKLIKKKPPERGYAHWSEDTFIKLTTGDPEPLTSSFDVSHAMVMNVLDRPGDGCGAMKTLLQTNHETRRRQRNHIRRTIAIYRSLVDSEVIETLDTPDDQGRLVRVTIDLQSDFALNQPLSPFAVEAVEALDMEDPQYGLDVLSVIESVLENPGVIVAAQLNLLRGETIGRLKAEGMEYDERMEELDKLEAPKPLADFLFPAFDIFRKHHPWVGGDNIAPKAIVRDIYERAMTFGEFVNHYKLKRSEGVVLRYLSDCFKALVQNVPEDRKTDDVYDLTEWLGEMVRQVDSSLIDEWERLRNPEPEQDAATETNDERPDVTRNERAFRVMVRNEAFRWIQLLSRKKFSDLAELAPEFSSDQLVDQMATYRETAGEILTGAEARSPELFLFDTTSDEVRQIIADPEQHHEWHLAGHVDLAASRDEGRAVLVLDQIVSPAAVSSTPAAGPQPLTPS